MQSIVFVLCALVALSAAEYKSTDDVVILTDATFEDVIEKNEFALVEFYAPWCGHCKSLEPEYKKAATALKGEKVVLGAMDATVHQATPGKFGVQGYPTLKFFINGKAIDYTGGRTSDTIISWIRKRLGPAAKTLEAGDIAAFAAASKVAIVGFFPSNTDATFKHFESLAQQNDEFSFGVSFDAEAAKANGLASGEGVVLFKKFDEGKNVLDGSNLSPADIKSFVDTNSVPIVIPFTMEVAGKIFQSPIGVIALLFSNDEVEGFSALAEKYRGKFVFSTADDSYDRLNSYIGVTADQFPEFYILVTGQALVKYPLEGDVTAATIGAHIDSYLAGSLKPFFKSEPIPADNDGPVTVVVGKNFNSVVLDENKDVFLEIYAPWCGHCKTLAPIWDKLGELYDDNENVVIAKMDGTGNEVDGIAIKGFPTLQFFPAGSKTSASGIAYNGGRDFDSLKKYLEENAKSAAPKADAKDEL